MARSTLRVSLSLATLPHSIPACSRSQDEEGGKPRRYYVLSPHIHLALTCCPDLSPSTLRRRTKSGCWEPSSSTTTDTTWDERSDHVGSGVRSRALEATPSLVGNWNNNNNMSAELRGSSLPQYSMVRRHSKQMPRYFLSHLNIPAALCFKSRRRYHPTKPVPTPHKLANG